MRLDDERPSENIEDRRGMGGGFGMPRGAGRIRIPVGRAGRGGIGIGGLVLLLAFAWMMGINPLVLLTGGGVTPQTEVRNAPVGDRARHDAGRTFVAKVLGTTERTWTRIFRERLRRRYEPPRLVLFSGA
ncbi:MAG TPA: hypothetical protein ENK13_01640, partial [Thermopetrobacter sp.]|nr:hypothetical protein [Thermopetrobacter sp.]